MERIGETGDPCGVSIGCPLSSPKVLLKDSVTLQSTWKVSVHTVIDLGKLRICSV